MSIAPWKAKNFSAASSTMSEIEKPTLALCPFCGGNGKWSPKHYATIITCDACGADGPPCESIEEAAGAWNRRAVTRTEARQMDSLLADAAQLMDGWKNQDPTCWSWWDQSIRDRISEMRKRLTDAWQPLI